MSCLARLRESLLVLQRSLKTDLKFGYENERHEGIVLPGPVEEEVAAALRKCRHRRSDELPYAVLFLHEPPAPQK